MSPAAATVAPPQALGVDQPVYVNPAALDNVEDLRRALERTNLQLAAQFNRAERAREALLQMGRQVSPMVVAHLKGDAAAVYDALQTLVERHVIVMPDPAAAGPH